MQLDLKAKQYLDLKGTEKKTKADEEAPDPKTYVVKQILKKMKEINKCN